VRRYPSAKELAALPAKPGRKAVGHNVYLQMAPGGTRSWIFRYHQGGVSHHLGLGSAVYKTLQEARNEGFELMRRLLRGEDITADHGRIRNGSPVEPKQEKPEKVGKVAGRVDRTFENRARAYIAAHESTWRGDASRKQWEQSLRKHVYPAIGAKSVDEIGRPEVLSVVDPLAKKHRETAGRVLNRIAMVLDWCHRESTGYINPARGKILPKKKGNHVKHLEMLPVGEMPAFMVELRKQPDIAARCLELQILIAGRPQDCLGARWGEIDLPNRTWKTSGARVKSGRDHVIPLSDDAVALLEKLPREVGNDHVFIGSRPGKGLNPDAMQSLLDRMGRKGLSSHGLARAGFRTWATEQTYHDDNAIEMALAHALPDAVHKAYQRGELLEKRKRLMADWAAYLAGGKS
jgi:integrase